MGEWVEGSTYLYVEALAPHAWGVVIGMGGTCNEGERSHTLLTTMEFLSVCLSFWEDFSDTSFQSQRGGVFLLVLGGQRNQREW